MKIQHCDDYQAIKKAIDDRVAELKASGAA
jgi:hypothetical protein